MHISSGRLGLLGFVLFVLLALPAMAQNRMIQGKVTDDKGQPIANASVVIQSREIEGRKYDCKTNKKGEYAYMGIAAGNYYIIVRAPGFDPEVQAATPSIQEPSIKDFKMTPGSPDRKLDIELSAQEKEVRQKEAEKAQKKKEASAEVQALFNAGLEFAKQGKHEEAIAEYKKALEKDAEQINIMANMADSYSKLNKNDDALAVYQKALTIKEDSALYTNMGVLLSKMGKEQESQEAFKKAADMNPAASAQNYYNMGATLVNSGKTQEAADAFKKAIAADANFAEAYYQLGMCLSGKPDTMPEAIKALEKYIQIGQKTDQVEVSKQIIQALQQALKK